MNQRAVNSIDRKLGTLIRSRRLELGVSQEKLAEQLGITFQQVQKYEKGVNRIAASRLYAIAEALKVDVWEFYSKLAPPQSAIGARDGAPNLNLDTSQLVRLVTIFKSIKSSQLRRRILSIIEAVIEEEKP